MTKGTLRILLMPLVLLALMLAAAEGANFRFKSVVPQKKWTRTLSGELVLPQGKGPFPAVIFLHPCAGITPPVRRSLHAHARMLARHGFAVLTFEVSARAGWAAARPVAGRLRLWRPFSCSMMRSMPKRRSRARPRSTATTFSSPGRVLGAIAALKAALKSQSLHDSAFRAAAAWYPSCRFLAYSTELKSPLLVLGGGKDDWTPPRICQSAKKDGRMTGAEYDVIVAPRALHGFDQPRKRYRYHGHWLGYDAGATAAGRKAMVAFFEKHLKK